MLVGTTTLALPTIQMLTSSFTGKKPLQVPEPPQHHLTVLAYPQNSGTSPNSSWPQRSQLEPQLTSLLVPWCPFLIHSLPLLPTPNARVNQLGTGFPSLESNTVMCGVEGTKDTGRTEEMLFLVVRRYQGPIRVEMAGVENVSLIHGVLSSKQRVTICHDFFNLHSVSED